MNVATRTGTALLRVRIENAPSSLQAPSLIAMQQATLDVVCAGVLLSPSSGFLVQDMPSPPLRILSGDGPAELLLPLPPHVLRESIRDQNASWPNAKGTQRATEPSEERGIRFAYRSDVLQVELDFTSYTAAMKQAGWLVRTVSVTYGSPFVTLLEVAAPVATASFITGLFAYISGGRSARKKQRAEADIADVLSRLAEEQQTAQLQESQAKARLAIAEARLKEIEVERAETRRNTKHHQRLDAEREKLLNLLAAFELLKNYGRTTDIAWQTEDYARLLAAPGLAAALRVLESSDVEADLLE